MSYLASTLGGKSGHSYMITVIKSTETKVAIVSKLHSFLFKANHLKLTKHNKKPRSSEIKI